MNNFTAMCMAMMLTANAAFCAENNTAHSAPVSRWDQVKSTIYDNRGKSIGLIAAGLGCVVLRNVYRVGKLCGHEEGKKWQYDHGKQNLNLLQITAFYGKKENKEEVFRALKDVDVVWKIVQPEGENVVYDESFCSGKEKFLHGVCHSAQCARYFHLVPLDDFTNYSSLE